MDGTLKKKMYIVYATCWKCKEDMNVAVIDGDAATQSGQVYGPESFSSQDFKVAEENGVTIKEHYSATRNENYYANTCLNCGTFFGQHYLFTEVFCGAKYGDYGYKEIDLE